MPVVASLAVSSSGDPLNVNADTVASQIAKAISPAHTIYLNSMRFARVVAEEIMLSVRPSTLLLKSCSMSRRPSHRSWELEGRD